MYLSLVYQSKLKTGGRRQKGERRESDTTPSSDLVTDLDPPAFNKRLCQMFQNRVIEMAFSRKWPLVPTPKAREPKLNHYGSPDSRHAPANYQ